MNDSLLPLLRRYDPDFIASSNVSLGELEEIDPGVIPRAATASGFSLPLPETTYRHFRELTTEPSLDNSTIQSIDQWCSPHTGLRQNEQSFEASDVLSLQVGNTTALALSSLPQAQQDIVYNVQLADADPLTELFIETRFGFLPTSDHEGRNIVNVSVPQSEVANLFRAVTTSQIPPSSGEWAAGIDGSNVLSRVPFSPLRQQLSKVSIGWRARHVCVIGDSPQDHALGIICDRIFTSGCWIPRTLLDRDDEIGRAARLALHSMIWSGGRGRDLPVAIVSSSEERDYLAHFVPVSGEATVDGQPVNLPKNAEIVTLDELAKSEEVSCMFADSKSFDTRRAVQLLRDGDDLQMVAPLQLPPPLAVADDQLLAWCTDIRLPGYQLPPRTAIKSSTLGSHAPGTVPEAKVRSSRFGLSFHSSRLGFVPGGASIEGRTANPFLRFISATNALGEIASKQGASVTISSAGRRGMNAVEMWGGFEELANDLQGEIRSLLDAFTPPRRAEKTGAYASGYAVRGVGYITFSNARATLGWSESRTKELLDRLASRGVLIRGFILGCERCLGKHHYNLENMRQASFTCPLCGHTNQLTSTRWGSNDPDPIWTYGLSYIVRDFLDQNGDVPLLASYQLSRGAESYVWSPEIALTYGNGDSIELDISMVRDGRVVIGEAKSNTRISGGRKTSTKAARRMVQAALTLSADEIVLATSRDDWSPSATVAISTALDELWTLSPKPQVTYMTAVGRREEVA
jgi:hypothetical protein